MFCKFSLVYFHSAMQVLHGDAVLDNSLVGIWQFLFELAV